MAEEYLTDDEQLEAVKHWFKEYAPWLAGGVLVGASLFFGYRYYQSYTSGQDLKAAGQFSAMTTALQANDHAKARRLAEELIKDYAKSPYADQAQLTLARLDVDENQLDKAIAPLTLVMNESKDTELRQIARLRLARVLTGQGKPDEAIKLLEGPIPQAFAASYREVRGDAYLAKKDIPHAVAEYQQALAAADVGGINTSLLELKLQDLGAVPAPKASAVSLDILKKAKP
jgi:predicted negative regulator of RcsB-dependent stress response